jgi:hypothetical protein
MGTQLERRDRRHPYQLEGAILARDGNVEITTTDVSFRGAFLKTDTPPPLRQLVRVRLVLPADFGAPHEITLTAMVVNIVPPGASHGRDPGAGVELYGASGELRAQWERFIRYVDELCAVTDHASAPTSRRPSPLRRDVHLSVDLEPVSKIQTVASKETRELGVQDISRGEMFVRTDAALGVGTGVVLDLVDPISRVPFPIDCVVRRREFGTNSGVAVQFLDMDAEAWRKLLAFLKPTAVIEESGASRHSGRPSARIRQARPAG